MPRLVRLYIVSVALGFALSLLFVTLLLVLDVGGLRHLVLGSWSGWLGGLMLVVFNTIVFAGVQFGIAVMRLADPPEPRGGRRIPMPLGPPARAAAVPGRRRQEDQRGTDAAKFRQSVF